jgi:hypothetical protein
MGKRAAALVAMSVVMAACGFAKDKKAALPEYVLRARTVSVMVDPQAGISIDDPRANQVAQKDVETALLNWGRFEPTLSAQGVDLIIVVRRGNAHLVDETISDQRQNNRSGVINPTDNGLSVGGQRGQLNGPGGPTRDIGQEAPHSQMEVGQVQDSFAVYDGSVADPLNRPPVWRYVAKDALRPHNVPAVEEFRKALAAAEKAAAAAVAKKP